MIFHWSLSDSKSPLVSRTLLSILANYNNAVVWMVVTIPLTTPVLINFFETILSWPVIHIVVSAGVFHISLWPQEYNRGCGRKRTNDKRTIWAWVKSKCKKGKFVTLHSLCICRLTLACILRETSPSY